METESSPLAPPFPIRRLVWLHGFRGPSGYGSDKAAAFRPYFPEVLAPKLPLRPRDAFGLALDLHVPGTAYAGISLGGFYAWLLSRALGCRAALANPVTRPWDAIRPGKHIRDGEEFEWPAAYNDELRELECEHPVHSTNGPIRAWLAQDDEVLDVRQVTADLGFENVVAVSGGHRLVDSFPAVASEVSAFISAC